MSKAPSFCSFPGCGNPVWPQNFPQHFVRHLKDGETYDISMRHQYQKSIVLKHKAEEKHDGDDSEGERNTDESDDDKPRRYVDLSLKDKLDMIEQYCRVQHREIKELRERIDQLESTSRSRAESFDFVGDNEVIEVVEHTDDDDTDEHTNDEHTNDEHTNDEHTNDELSPAVGGEKISKISGGLRPLLRPHQSDESVDERRSRSETLGLSSESPLSPTRREHISKIPIGIRKNPELLQATIEAAKEKRTRAEKRRLQLSIDAEDMISNLPEKRQRRPRST